MTRLLVLPYPPSVNHYWRRVGNKTLISREGRAYRTAVMARVLERPEPRLTGPLDVVIALEPPDRRRRDVDNFNKAVLDCLTHAGVYEDDSQIVRLLVLKCPPRPKQGAAVVYLRQSKSEPTVQEVTL